MQRINQEVVEDYAAYRMPADSRVHSVKREGKHCMCESACEQMPPASSNPTASTCVVDGWTVQLDTNSRRGPHEAPDLPATASRAYTWGPSQRPTNCRFGVLYCTNITFGFGHTLSLSLLHHNGERSHAPSTAGSVTVSDRQRAVYWGSSLVNIVLPFFLTKLKLHAYQAKGCFSQIQGKYNSNLAYQEKLAHGMEIHHHVVSNSTVGQSKHQPLYCTPISISFNFQPWKNLIQRHACGRRVEQLIRAQNPSTGSILDTSFSYIRKK